MARYLDCFLVIRVKFNEMISWSQYSCLFTDRSSQPVFLSIFLWI